MNARLVYEAPPLTVGYAVLAVATLGALFALTLAYVAIVPLALWWLWSTPSVWLATLMTLALSSPLWGAACGGTWRAFGRARGFEAWRRYFGLRVYREKGAPEALPPRNTLVALMPHGLFPLILPMLSAIQEQVFEEFGPDNVPRTAVATAMLWTPVLAPMLRWFGCVAATRDAMQGVLRAGGNCLLVPDGIAGAYHSRSDEEVLYLSARRGFIRTALQEGATLMPAYCYGHTQLWDVWPRHDSWLARAARRMQFSLIWFVGEWWCPPLPRRTPLTLVMGSPMALAKTPHPSDADVDAAHQQFTHAMSRLYYAHRALAGPAYANKTLLIQ